MDTRREDPTIGTTGGGQAAQDHLAELRDRGGRYRSIAAAAGLGPMTVRARAARRRAIAGNWCAGAALDDDQLDIPGYRPGHGWKRATGTGPATDIPLPAQKSGDRAALARPERKAGRIA